MSPLAWILLSVLTILIIILIIRAARNKKKKKGKVSVQMPAEEEHSTQNGQLSCDVCGSHAIIKSGDSFYCQECGCRYTLEEMQARLAARPCRQPSCPPNAPAPKKKSRGCLITFIIIVVILAAILIPIISPMFPPAREIQIIPASPAIHRIIHRASRIVMPATVTLPFNPREI